MRTIKKRNIWIIILLTIITFGIYWLVLCVKMGKDVDAICKGDEEPEVHFIIALLLGAVSGGTYLTYWWYKQINRLKLNAGRYGVTVQTRGIDFVIVFLIFSVIGIPITYAFTLFIFYPLLYSFQIVLGVMLYAIYLLIYSGVAYFIYYSTVIKNINLFAGVYGNINAYPFDPMGGFHDPYAVPENNSRVMEEEDESNTVMFRGGVRGVSGTNAGYRFDLTDGEEIIIGKNPSVSHIIVDKTYKEVSRKHCGIIYRSKTRDYQVIDYSSNGTFIDGGKRLVVQVYTTLGVGTTLTLGKSDNVYRLE